MSNHFAKKKPTVALYHPPEWDEPKALCGENGKPIVFPTYYAARAHIDEFADDDQKEHFHFVNEVPQPQAGDLEYTGGKRCLKCDTPVVPSNHKLRTEVAGQRMVVEEFFCPKCDAPGG